MSKTVVITGSSQGIGFALSKEFIKHGFNVVINGRGKSRLEQAVERLNSKQAVGLAGDVRESSTIEKLWNLATEKFGKIDIWINNAAIPQNYSLFHNLPMSQVVDLLDINVKAVILATHFVINKMLRQGYGVIYNTLGFGYNNMKRNKLTLYGTSKCALRYFTESLMQEYKNSAIKIGWLQPGMTDTNFLIKGMQGASPEEVDYMKRVNKILAENPQKVAKYLAARIMKGDLKINYSRFSVMFPKILKLMFIK